MNNASSAGQFGILIFYDMASRICLLYIHLNLSLWALAIIYRPCIIKIRFITLLRSWRSSLKLVLHVLFYPSFLSITFRLFSASMLIGLRPLLIHILHHHLHFFIILRSFLHGCSHFLLCFNHLEMGLLV